MQKRQATTINDSQHRLDKTLQAMTGLSRKKVKSLIDQGRALVNGRKVIIASWVIKPSDRVEMLKEGAESLPDASQHYLKVVYEDNDILVVEKDAGVPCEKSALATKPTLISIINAYFKRKYPHLKHHYLGLVHRLDTETSGLMVYTRTKEANRITDQFKRHTIKRKYLAVVEGQILDQGGTIENFLKKSSLLKGGKKVTLATAATGRRALTHFRVLERYPKATLVELNLNTGRTHQIRVQMASIGHPVLGDTIYGKPGKSSRQALHAAYLGFHHPTTGQKMEFSADLPRDLRRMVDRLRIKS